MYLIDTNVLSEIRKARSKKADPRVVNWLNSIEYYDLFISVITLMEVEIGIRLKMRRDAVQGEGLRRWFDQQVLPGFEGRILDVDREIALKAAPLHVPDPKPDRDALIAGTALYRDFTVVTRNIRDFDKTGVKLLNPWTFSAD